MRKDQLLVTTQGVRGGKKHHNVQGTVKVAVLKGFNEDEDVIEVDGYVGYGASREQRETALMNITFKSGQTWYGDFRKLQSALFPDQSSIEVQVAIGHEIAKICGLKVNSKTGRVNLLEGYGSKSIQGLGAVILRIVDEQTKRLNG